MTDVTTYFKEARQKRSKRAKQVAYAQARAEVYERSGGLCEAAVEGRCPHQGSEAHHKRRRSQGGADTADNLVWLCELHHRWVHANPTAAIDVGLLVPTTFSPAPGLLKVTRTSVPSDYNEGHIEVAGREACDSPPTVTSTARRR